MHSPLLAYPNFLLRRMLLLAVQVSMFKYSTQKRIWECMTNKLLLLLYRWLCTHGSQTINNEGIRLDFNRSSACTTINYFIENEFKLEDFFVLNQQHQNIIQLCNVNIFYENKVTLKSPLYSSYICGNNGQVKF